MVGLVSVLTGCSGSRPGPPTNLPAPTTSTTIGPGDTLEITINDEKELPKDFKVQGDGNIDFPYIGVVKVAGLEPHQINELVRNRLAEEKVRYKAIVNTVPKTYASKKVQVVGQVAKSGSYPWTEKLGLLDLIAQAGGFNSIADSNHVILRRQTGGGKTVTVTVSVDAISDGQQPDIILQEGDSIKVEARVF